MIIKSKFIDYKHGHTVIQNSPFGTQVLKVNIIMQTLEVCHISQYGSSYILVTDSHSITFEQTALYTNDCMHASHVQGVSYDKKIVI